MKELEDEHADGVMQARLGRRARDVIEATIVLEAWLGRPAHSAMSAARGLVAGDGDPKPDRGRVEAPEGDEQQGVLVEGVALVLSILSVAAWATPLSRVLGDGVLAAAIGVALPISVALQWALRSRYLSRRTGLALLARDGLALCALTAFACAVPLALMPGWGPLAAILVAIWVGGTVVTRRGWGLLYALTLVATSVALAHHAQPYLVLGLLTAFTLSVALAAVLTRRAATEERAGTMSRALVAGLLGGAIGLLLVSDPSLGWGVHGVHPAIALVPSVIGSFWGGYYLWNLYEAVPRGLSGVPLHRAGRAAMTDPAMMLFLGAILRLVGATVVLSGVLLFIGRWTHGTDDVSVLFAFGCVALVSLLVGLLESLGRRRAGLIACSAALAVELAWPQVVGTHLAGGALAAGATVGIALTIPPLLVLLARSGRVLATTLWIQ
ncbi:MAG: hypothetical protein JO304_07205 [Solirubrobacterales bacterium]|nr:hypothetical protein [Solirubrobacterales bacterium]